MIFFNIMIINVKESIVIKIVILKKISLTRAQNVKILAQDYIMKFMINIFVKININVI